MVWFLVNRPPPYDIKPVQCSPSGLAYEDQNVILSRDPCLRDMLYLTKGILSHGGKSVKIITKNNDGVALEIKTYKHEQNHDRWMKTVQFYIGFSITTGPKAFLI